MDQRDIPSTPLRHRATVLPCPPRFFSLGGRRGVVANTVTLLLTGVLGAALMHLITYHLRSGSSGACLLAHCPWRVGLLIVAAAALANGVLLRRELRPLARGA